MCIVRPAHLFSFLLLVILPYSQAGVILFNELPGESQPSTESIAKEQHDRNCFFTPVQCMLPPNQPQRDILQSLRGVYHTADYGQTLKQFSPWSLKRSAGPVSRYSLFRR